MSLKQTNIQENFDSQKVVASIDGFVKDLTALFRIVVNSKLVKLILEQYEHDKPELNPVSDANRLIDVMQNMFRYDERIIEMMNGGITPAMIARTEELFKRLLAENGEAYDMGLEQVGLDMDSFDEVHHVLKLIRARDDFHHSVENINSTES